VEAMIHDLHPDELTPIEALRLVYAMKEKLGSRSG